MKNIERRSFIKSTSAAAALVAACGAHKAIAQDEEQIRPGQAQEIHDVEISRSLCNACPNQCGIRLFVEKGKYWKLLGDKNHPHSKGHLCTRGYGYPRANYSEMRISSPMRKTQGAKLEACSWDEALQMASQAINEQHSKDPQGIALLQDARASKQRYGKRFINALGSAQYFSDAANSNLALLEASLLSMGCALTPDYEHAKCCLFVGKSYGQGFRPHELPEIMKAKASDMKMIYLGPKLDESSSIVDLWIPVRAGTELAFLLGLAAYIIKRKAFDKNFVNQYCQGFEEFAQSLRGYDFESMFELCGISSQIFEDCADSLIDAAPAALVDTSWNGVFGAAYHNSFDTARCSILINALLGNINQKGGCCILPEPQLKEEGGKIKELPKIQAQAYGAENHPLLGYLSSSAADLLEACKAGNIGVLIIQGSNIVRDFIAPKDALEALSKVPCKIYIGSLKDETAAICDVVLPEMSYLEQKDCVQSFAGIEPVVAIRRALVDKICEEAKSFDEIYTQLAALCGVAEYFDFSLDEFNAQLISSLGLNYEQLLKEGMISMGKQFEYGAAPQFYTPSKKLEFSLDLAKKAGLQAVPSFDLQKALKQAQDLGHLALLSQVKFAVDKDKFSHAASAGLSKSIADKNWEKEFATQAPSAGMQLSAGAAATASAAAGDAGAASEAAPKATAAQQVKPERLIARLITGEQSMHSKTATSQASYLAEISKMYKLDELLINDKTAALYELKSGDKVELISDRASTKAVVKTTSCIEPCSVFAPLHYAAVSSDDFDGLETMSFKELQNFMGKQAYLQSASKIEQHRSPKADAATGAYSFNEVLVEIKKVNA